MTDYNLNEYEKIRLTLKIMWEGGLSNYIDYGVASCLYNSFKKEFDEIFLLEEKQKYDGILELKIQELEKKTCRFFGWKY